MSRLLAQMSPAERKRFTDQASQSAMYFTAVNPTGHYCLKIGQKVDEGIFSRVIGLGCAQRKVDDELAKVRKPGHLEVIQWCCAPFGFAKVPFSATMSLHQSVFY